MFYLSFFPQFLDPERGSVLLQSLALGAVQITISGSVNALLILGAAGITALLSRSRGWLLAQRYLMGAVLGGLAVRIALTEKQ
jgi:threonine/homoserine/homoserine lactone efflux protein